LISDHVSLAIEASRAEDTETDDRSQREREATMTPTGRSASWSRTCAILVVAGVVSLFAAPASAQSGVLRDGTGGVLPGVDVTLTAVGTGIERRAVTNDAGLYTFPNVPVGEYRITATLTGFRPVTHTGLNVTAGVNVRVDVQLALGHVSETIQVVATTLLDTAVIGRTLRAEEIAETPLSGRRASFRTTRSTLTPRCSFSGARSGSAIARSRR
jgi:hypothetical protein